MVKQSSYDFSGEKKNNGHKRVFFNVVELLLVYVIRTCWTLST